MKKVLEVHNAVTHIRTDTITQLYFASLFHMLFVKKKNNDKKKGKKKFLLTYPNMLSMLSQTHTYVFWPKQKCPYKERKQKNSHEGRISLYSKRCHSV